MLNPDNHHVRSTPYVHEPFPSVRYHRDGSMKVIATQEEHDELELDPDYAESPAAFEEGGAKFVVPAEPGDTAAEAPAPEDKKKKTTKKA